MSRAPVDTPMTCRELVGLVSDYLEGGLEGADRERFETHIGECPPCSGYLEQMRLLIGATGRLTEEQLDPEARGELLAAFRSWKR